jgi:serine/threonine protein kinase
MGKCPWSEPQYASLCYIIVKNVLELHRQKIAHRDIRPYNFVYSMTKRGFLLGGLQHSVVI